MKVEFSCSIMLEDDSDTNSVVLSDETNIGI